MDLSTAVSATVSTLRRRPADLLPFYLLGTAVPVVARMGLLVSLAGVYLHYELSGRLGAVRDAFADADLAPPDVEDPEALERWAEGLIPAFEPLLTPTAGALLVTGLLATVLLAILTYAAVSAGQMSAVVARLRSERGLTAGIAGVRERGYEVRNGGSLYSDSMGARGTPEGTYTGMFRYNVETIVQALTEDLEQL